MVTIIFYEKPGCANNARQKRLLKNAGHEVQARDLLTEAWTRPRLQEFFGDLPVADWFNRAAPRIKHGEIIPELIDADTALSLLLAEPLLIRRPLMQTANKFIVGFDADRIAQWFGIALSPDKAEDLQTCQHRKPDLA